LTSTHRRDTVRLCLTNYGRAGEMQDFLRWFVRDTLRQPTTPKDPPSCANSCALLCAIFSHRLLFKSLCGGD